MSSVKTISTALALALAGTGMAAQAGMVIKSSGPSAGKYKPGTQLEAGSQITLKAGDSVTVLDKATGTQVISGEGTHRVGKRGTSKRQTFAVLTRKSSSRRGRVGAIRGGATPASTVRSPNLWYVDVSQSATVCVSSPEAVRLWRPGTEGDSTYVVANANSPDHVHISFTDGEMDTNWDLERLPLSDGTTYLLTGPDGGEASEVTFKMLPEASDDAEVLAQQLIEKGCGNQLDLLTSAMS